MTRKQYDDGYRLLRDIENASAATGHSCVKEANIAFLEEQFAELPATIRKAAHASFDAAMTTPHWKAITGWRNHIRLLKFTGGKTVTYFLSKRMRS